MMSVATSQIILFEAIIQRRPLSTTPPPSWPRPRPSYVDAVFSIPSIWSEAVIRRATTDGCPSASVASILQLQSVLSNQQQSIEKRFVHILFSTLCLSIWLRPIKPGMIMLFKFYFKLQNLHLSTELEQKQCSCYHFTFGLHSSIKQETACARVGCIDVPGFE